MYFRLDQVVGTVRRRLAPSDDSERTDTEGKRRLDVPKRTDLDASGTGRTLRGQYFRESFGKKGGEEKEREAKHE